MAKIFFIPKANKAQRVNRCIKTVLLSLPWPPTPGPPAPSLIKRIKNRFYHFEIKFLLFVVSYAHARCPSKIDQDLRTETKRKIWLFNEWLMYMKKWIISNHMHFKSTLYVKRQLWKNKWQNESYILRLKSVIILQIRIKESNSFFVSILIFQNMFIAHG